MRSLQVMTKPIVLCVICFNCVVYSKAGNDNYSLGARSAGMATASVTVTDIWSSANNQAGLGYLEQTIATMYYENRLNVKSLSIQAGAFAIPVQSTVIGINYRYLGYSKYNESKFGLAVAKKLGTKFSLGVQVDYLHTHFVPEYGNFGALCGEVGLLCEPVEHLIVGIHLFNVSRSKQKASPNEEIPTVMRFGAGYTVQDKATVYFETEKDLRMDAVFKGGLEYTPVDNLFLRCGLSTGPAHQYAFGLGYELKRMVIDLAFSHHRYFGYSPHISLAVKL